jgi:anti-anti-sigma factor
MSADHVPHPARGSPVSSRTHSPSQDALAAWSESAGAVRSHLSIVCEQHEDLVLLRLEGELDAYTARVFRHEVGRWDVTAVQLVVDLSAVGLLDSAGLGALISLRNEADRAGHTVAIIRPGGGAIARLVRLCGLHRAFVIDADLRGVRRALRCRRDPMSAVGGGRPRSGAWA